MKGTKEPHVDLEPQVADLWFRWKKLEFKWSCRVNKNAWQVFLSPFLAVRNFEKPSSISLSLPNCAFFVLGSHIMENTMRFVAIMYEKMKTLYDI